MNNIEMINENINILKRQYEYGDQPMEEIGGQTLNNFTRETIRRILSDLGFEQSKWYWSKRKVITVDEVLNYRGYNSSTRKWDSIDKGEITLEVLHNIRDSK